MEEGGGRDQYSIKGINLTKVMWRLKKEAGCLTKNPAGLLRRWLDFTEKLEVLVILKCSQRKPRNKSDENINGAFVSCKGTTGFWWHWTWADNLFTVCSGESINKCWVISARSNYPCRWQGECVSAPLHPRPCPEGFELVRECSNTRVDMHRCTFTQEELLAYTWRRSSCR